MNDFFGVEIKIGDVVACNTPHYRGLCEGKVIALTKQKVRIEYNNTWNFGPGGMILTYLTEPNNIIVDVLKTALKGENK